MHPEEHQLDMKTALDKPRRLPETRKEARKRLSQPKEGTSQTTPWSWTVTQDIPVVWYLPGSLRTLTRRSKRIMPIEHRLFLGGSKRQAN